MTRLEEVEAAERRMDVHIYGYRNPDRYAESIEPPNGVTGTGLTVCGIDAQAIAHSTTVPAKTDCARCARVYIERECIFRDPFHCDEVDHRIIARLAYPKMEVVR